MRSGCGRTTLRQARQGDRAAEDSNMHAAPKGWGKMEELEVARSARWRRHVEEAGICMYVVSTRVVQKCTVGSPLPVRIGLAVSFTIGMVTRHGQGGTKEERSNRGTGNGTRRRWFSAGPSKHWRRPARPGYEPVSPRLYQRSLSHNDLARNRNTLETFLLRGVCQSSSVVFSVIRHTSLVVICRACVGAYRGCGAE